MAASACFSSKNMRRVKLSGSSNTSGTWFIARTASDWLSSMLTRKFVMWPSGSMASARRPSQPYCSPRLGAPVCQKAIEEKCENDGWS